MSEHASEGRTLHVERVHPPRKFAHVVFETPRFEAMKRWYARVLGAQVAHDNGAIAFMSFDDEHHRLALVNRPEAQPAPDGSARVHHMAWTLGTLGELLATYRRLASEGIRPFWCVNHGVTTSMYYRDPDGHGVELQVENFETPAEATAYITGPEFAANPIGVEYDPERLCERYEAGERESELKRMVRPDAR